MHLEADTLKSVTNRLKRAQGQLSGALRMLEEEERDDGALNHRERPASVRSTSSWESS